MGWIDIFFLYFWNVDCEKYLDYLEELYLDISWNFFICIEDVGKIKYESLDDLKLFKVGVMCGVFYILDFWNVGLIFEFEVENIW